MYRKLRWTKAVIIIFLCMIVLNFGNTVHTQQSDDEIYFTILHTNDEHSSLIPHSSTTDYQPNIKNPAIGGYARLSTLVKNIRKEKKRVDEPVLLLSGGDFTGGTPFGWMIPKGYTPELAIKQTIGYDGVTMGNHEFDYGTDILTEYLINAGYPAAKDKTPFIVTNVKIDKNHPMNKLGLYEKYHVKTLSNGLKVGIFGVIGEDAIAVTADHTPFKFKSKTEAAKEAVSLFEDNGVDIVIALSHSGVQEDKKLAGNVPGIDIIVGGHSHTPLKTPIIINETVIVQAGSRLKYLGRVELAYNRNTENLSLRDGKPVLIPVDSTVSEDAEILKIIDNYTSAVNNMIQDITNDTITNIRETVAISDFSLLSEPSLSETTFGNFTADAMRIITSKKTGEKVDVAIQANGSIRGTLNPGKLSGEISFYDIASLVGLGYEKDGNPGYSVTAFYLTGEEILRALEVAALLPELKGNKYFLQISGLKYEYNPRDAVLFNIPFVNFPVPTTKAVKSAELYTKDGIQSNRSNDYVPIKNNGQKLYRVVCDSNILKYLPMAGELLPQLKIVPKDAKGNPVKTDNFDKLIVYDGEDELKVWQTIVEYTKSQPVGDKGYPKISRYYQKPSGRIETVYTIPLSVWLSASLVVIICGIGLLIYKKKNG